MAVQLNNDDSNSGLLNHSTPNRRSIIRPLGEGSSDSAASSSGVNQFIDHDSRLLSDWDHSYTPYGSELLGRNTTTYPFQRSFNVDDNDDVEVNFGKQTYDVFFNLLICFCCFTFSS